MGKCLAISWIVWIEMKWLEHDLLDLLALDTCLDGILGLGLQPLTGANGHEFSFSDI